MNRDSRVRAFVKLGEFFGQFKNSGIEKNNLQINEKFYDEFLTQINRAIHYNGWFTKDNVLFSIEEWAGLLTEDKLNNWLSNYNNEVSEPKTIGLIMAGNIPLVGFHDFLSVLISGNKVIAKLSSNDNKFFPIIASLLIDVEPKFADKIKFVSDKLTGYDAVIATGSNNTARYFNHYFKDYPSIIRQNRNSVSVLSGDESEAELKLLAEDIFRYFGLGCRSVSKLYVPKGYDFDNLFKAIFSYKDLVNHAKYANNYDYNKAVYLMSKFKILENGFFMLKEDPSYGSPIATLFYEFYETEEAIKTKLELDFDKIQCVVASANKDYSEVEFGKSQHPLLNEYADGVDTLEFLFAL
ncbi:MAG: acyl-CoA reductase [Ichthyobacteriaceae bacterium]|nr:acyl-CoA reductase [Ichthyobacteriaceae bacterium]